MNLGEKRLFPFLLALDAADECRPTTITAAGLW
jgi:hypothetical protein